MRVTHISVSAQESDLFSTKLIKPGATDRFIMRGMIGLDADEVITKFYGYGAQNNDKFYRMGLKPREVVMRLVLNPTWSIGETYSDLRDEMYRAISAARNGEVTINFYASATNVAELKGYITKFEVPHFSKDAEVQITIMCEDPILRGVQPVEYYTNHFTGPSVIIADQFSTAPHGFEMQVTFTGTTAAFTIQDASSPDWQFEVVPSSSFLTSDVLYFSSYQNDKQLYMTRSSVVTHLMDKLVPGSVWPSIFPGRNTFYIPALVPTATITVDWLKFKPAYWGV